MSKERFEHTEDGITNYIEDSKTGIIYIGSNYYDMKDITKLLNKQCQRIIDLEEQLSNAIIPNKEYYVIVTNGWKKQVYGVAKVHQRLEDIYTYCTDNTIGCFSPLTQYGTFDTLEEANERLKELKQYGKSKNNKGR